MNDHEDIQKLIGLKRYEMPPEGFVDDLLIKLHERQRAELLHQSALSLAWERLITYIQHWSTPQWSLATATATLMIAAVVAMNSHPSEAPMAGKVVIPEGHQLAVSYFKASAPEASPIVFDVSHSGTKVPIREIDLLLGNHFHSGLPNEVGIVRAGPPAKGSPSGTFSASPTIMTGSVK